MHCLPHLSCIALPSLTKHLPDSFHLDSWYFVLNHKIFVWEQFTEAWNKVVSNGTSSEEHCSLTALRITRVRAVLWPSKLLRQPAVINSSRRLNPEYFGMGAWQTYLSSKRCSTAEQRFDRKFWKDCWTRKSSLSLYVDGWKRQRISLDGWYLRLSTIKDCCTAALLCTGSFEIRF